MARVGISPAAAPADSPGWPLSDWVQLPPGVVVGDEHMGSNEAEPPDEDIVVVGAGAGRVEALQDS